MSLQLSVLFIGVCAFLYRWGGGGFEGLPRPFNEGIKGIRRYALPGAILIYTRDPMLFPGLLVLTIVLHFNLDEIKERDFDDVFCYGLAQSFGLHLAGSLAGVIALWWLVGVWLSNMGIPWWRRVSDHGGPHIEHYRLKLDWFWVELIHGAVIGAVVATRWPL